MVEYTNTDVISYSDYYPFGMLMPNRYHHPSDDNSYGFQGQEMDDEIKGEGVSANYKYRMNDTRIGRFFAEDPLVHKYPMLSPYHFSHNSPIYTVEIEGLEGNALYWVADGFKDYFAGWADMITFQSSGSVSASHNDYGSYSASYSVNTNSFSQALLSESTNLSDYFDFGANFSVKAPKGDLGPILHDSEVSYGTEGGSLSPINFSTDDSFIPFPMRVGVENEIDGEGAKTKSYLNYQAGPYNFDFSYSNNSSTGEEIYETSVGIGTKDNQLYGKHTYSSTEGHSVTAGVKASVKKEVGGWTVEAKADISATIKLD